MLNTYSVSNLKISIYKNQCMITSMMWNSFEVNAQICQLTDALIICLTHALLSFLYFQPWFHSDAFWSSELFLFLFYE